MSIPVLIIPVLNRFDLLEQTLASIDYPVDNILVIDNSGTLSLPEQDNLTVLNMPNNFGVAASWNLGIKCFPQAAYWMIGSNDNPWFPGSMAIMADMASEDNLVWSDKAWDCYTIGSNLVKKVGLFDENYYPAYYEDTDYSERLRLHGMMDAIVHSNAPMNQIGTCTTIGSDDDLARKNEITNQSNREYFYTKIYGGDWDSWDWDLQRRIDNDWSTDKTVEETPSTTFRYEDPDIHWHDVEIQDRVVLDLGAGDFGRLGEHPYPATADYWLSNGATKVIAVDMEAKDLDNYTDPRIEKVVISISGPEDISNLIQQHQPDLVKSDLEGAETHFLNVFPDVLRIPKAYAIETHNSYLFENISSMLKMLGYNIVWTMHHEIEDYVSVIYAERMF
jgi:hypothetical protein